MGFLQNLFKKPDASKNIAKERLHLVIMHDRCEFSPAFLENIRKDMVEVISKYLVVEEKDCFIELSRKENQFGTVLSVISANMTIKRQK